MLSAKVSFLFELMSAFWLVPTVLIFFSKENYEDTSSVLVIYSKSAHWHYCYSLHKKEHCQWISPFLPSFAYVKLSHMSFFLSTLVSYVFNAHTSKQHSLCTNWILYIHTLFKVPFWGTGDILTQYKILVTQSVHPSTSKNFRIGKGSRDNLV